MRLSHGNCKASRVRVKTTPVVSCYRPHSRESHVSIQVALNHSTVYTYDRLVSLGPQVIRLRPAPHCRTGIEAYSLRIEPENHFLNWQQDPFGNYLARAVFPEKLRRFSVTVDLVAEHTIFNPFDFFLDDYVREFPFAYEPALQKELQPYMEVNESGRRFDDLVREFTGRSAVGTIDFVLDINRRINAAIGYIVRLEPGIQSPEETLRLASGSCRDVAWLFCQLLRKLGLATRFASGYLIQLVADEKPLEGPAGTDHDFTDLHAWTEVYLPGAGWVGLDPTSGLLAGEGHIPLCCTPSPQSAAPISGTVDPSESRLEHHMSITRIHEDRRITRPYSDEEWAAINRAGRAVDAELERHDVRLTMGGEPTFVSIDDRDAPEWTTAANGVAKKRVATELFHRLTARFATGALRHFGQGKWYPGEPLPRWSLSAYWRRDGEPLWRQPAGGPTDEDRGDADSRSPDAAPASSARTPAVPTPAVPTTADAQRLISTLARYLAVPAEAVLPAYEDTVYHLWREGKLPLHGELLRTDLFERAERERLLRTLETGLGEPVGYALPLMYSVKRRRWISNRWEFSGGALQLVSGDSPIGLRLPTSSLPFVPEEELEHIPEPSGFAPKAPLPSTDELEAAVRARADARHDFSYFAADRVGRVRTSLCVEVRDEQLHVFMPPVVLLEHYVDLLMAVECAAADCGLQPVVEGYPPPQDVRLQSFKVTPDPGVIEVNVQPATSWEQASTICETIYSEARECRLAADKFLLDGQRVGTGGGNHIVLGGAAPPDSPFLRRPSLLRSMLAFWNNHPSLSYLFSSLFIGPTSQAPRVDEARDDMLYELEIAFARVNDREPTPAWLVDRLFRNILVDVGGNTHRAEFCIDKLYSPDGENGRLGLVELRNLEMPPHWNMAMVQALLIRACVARFWSRPYEQPLVHWGTRLHDEFMLPHRVQRDLHVALQELSHGAVTLDPVWFEPFVDFRFPVLGRVRVAGVEIEVRRALEPWHVLGEESGGGGVSRSVDASLSRLQLRVSGDLEPTRKLTCNNIELPLRPTADGAWVAGVRYKAWSPPSSLHPTIPVHTPLVIDLVDLPNRRSLGGCRIHVGHPGGRNYETMPVNENEAEGRRLALFEPRGHSPGRIRVEPFRENPVMPWTLDLRLYPDQTARPSSRPADSTRG